MVHVFCGRSHVALCAYIVRSKDPGGICRAEGRNKHGDSRSAPSVQKLRSEFVVEWRLARTCCVGVKEFGSG